MPRQIQWRKNRLFQQKVLKQLNSTSKKNEVGFLSNNILKKNSKWIKELNVRYKTMKILDENTGVHLYNLGLDNGF